MNPNRTARFAARFGWTEGQIYTAVLGAVVAVLLAVTGIPATLRDKLDQPAVAAEPRADGQAPRSGGGAALEPVDVGLGRTPTTSGMAEGTDGVLSPTNPAGGGDDAPTVAAPPCGAQAGVDAAREALTALAAASGGIVPDQGTTDLIAALSGCSAVDPATVALGILVELGSGLPDLGFDLPLPPVPPVELPAPILDALVQLDDVVGPVCASVSASVSIIVIVLGSYPYGISAVALSGLGPILSVCGQVQGAT